MNTLIAFVLGNINIWSPILALVIGLSSAQARAGGCAGICTTTLRWFMLLTVGLMGVQAFIMHSVFAGYTAHAIGWKTSPFQYEVAIANLSFGVLGVIAFFKKSYAFRLATGIGFSVWLFGDGVGAYLSVGLSGRQGGL